MIVYRVCPQKPSRLSLFFDYFIDMLSKIIVPFVSNSATCNSRLCGLLSSLRYGLFIVQIVGLQISPVKHYVW